jgi:hypothetical protein
MFGNRMLKGMVGPKIEDETGYWRKFHNEELHDFRARFSPKYYSDKQIKEGETIGALSRIGEMRNACEVFVGNP